MKREKAVLLISCLTILVLILTGCNFGSGKSGRNPEPAPGPAPAPAPQAPSAAQGTSAPQGEQETDALVLAYVEKFIRDGYSPYYEIQGVKTEIRKRDRDREKIEYMVFTTMTARYQNADNPDAVAYIKETKDRAAAAKDPEEKRKLEAQYQMQKQEHATPFQSNFNFRYRAELRQSDGTLIPESIKLELEQDSGPPGEVIYVPASDLFKK